MENRIFSWPHRQDETEEFLRLSVDPDHHIPVIHLHFNDDLTEVPGGLGGIVMAI